MIVDVKERPEVIVPALRHTDPVCEAPSPGNRHLCMRLPGHTGRHHDATLWGLVSEVWADPQEVCS